MGSVVEISGRQWEKEVLQAVGPVMVDLWAPWCGPCRTIAPVVEELSREYQGKVSIFKLNTDENPDVMSRYQVMGIPTLLFFRDGQIVDRIVGAVPKAKLKERLEAVLPK